MARCKVIKLTAGWNIGDTIEAFDQRLKELVDQGIVEIVIPDVEEKEEIVEAPVAKKTRKKKGA